MLDRYSSIYLNGLTLASTRGLTFGFCALLVFLVLIFRKENNIKEGYKKRGPLLIFLLIIKTKFLKLLKKFKMQKNQL